jgi:hypothetical protein
MARSSCTDTTVGARASSRSKARSSRRRARVPLDLRHRDCGEPVHQVLVCETGHQHPGARDVRVPVPRVAVG